MIEKAKQYKNLILLIIAAVLLTVLIVADPLGFCARRAQQRAAIYNQMAVEKAEAEKEIAIIKARTKAELSRIQKGLDVVETESDVVILTDKREVVTEDFVITV